MEVCVHCINLWRIERDELSADGYSYRLWHRVLLVVHQTFVEEGFASFRSGSARWAGLRRGG